MTGHPSDNLGGILAVADTYAAGSGWGQPCALAQGRDVLAHRHDPRANEIQGCLLLENSFNRVVPRPRPCSCALASTAVSDEAPRRQPRQVVDRLSHGSSTAPRCARTPCANAGPRKSWPLATRRARAVASSLWSSVSEIGYPSALSAPTWGFYDVAFKGNRFAFQRPYGSYVMENVLFKISFPAEFHAQTAVEAAVQLHPSVAGRLDDIERIVLTTHESAIRIISKTGDLNNPADRDHCLQYMVAVGLLNGDLTADDYEDDAARNPRIDQLREGMVVEEDARYSREYHEPDKRSIANAVQVHFTDGTSTDKVAVEYPIGHRRRRGEGIPRLVEKFEANLATRFPTARARAISDLCLDRERFEGTPVDEFMGLLVI